jgi:NDP-sugar pyrophosphorylase family protein
VSRYGIIAGQCVGHLDGVRTGDEDEGAVWKVTGLVEKPKPEDAPSHLFIVGRYLLSPRIMELLATQAPGAGNEIQLTDSMQRLLAEEEMYALVVDPSRRMRHRDPRCMGCDKRAHGAQEPPDRGGIPRSISETSDTWIDVPT